MRILKPCPFCGGSPAWQLTKKKGCQLHGEPNQNHILGCFKPSCRMRPTFTHCSKSWCIVEWETRNGEGPTIQEIHREGMQ